MSLLKANDLWFRYPHASEWLIRDISLEVDPGDIIALKGASGCGKTTLLFLLAGIIPRHQSGEIKGSINLPDLDHSALSQAELSTHISLVMQNPQQQLFFPTVEQELAFAPENLCLSPEEIDERISDALNCLNISNLRDNLTAHLSYGQQKLVALSAIHTLNPNILLLDEISNGISLTRQEDVKNLISAYRDSGKAVVMAEHDQQFLALANKTISFDENGASQTK